MKKMTKTNAAKIFKGVSKWDATIDIDFNIGDVSVPVKVYRKISLSDTMKILDQVLIAAFINGEYNRLFHYGTLARCIVEYLTDIPVPMADKDEDGNEIADLNICYEIVFGEDGLAHANDEFEKVVCTLCEVIDDVVEKKNANLSSTNLLSQKILDMADYTKRVINEMIEDPDSITDLISSLMNEDDVLDNKKEFEPEVIDGGK